MENVHVHGSPETWKSKREIWNYVIELPKASLHYFHWYPNIVYVNLGNMRDVIIYAP